MAYRALMTVASIMLVWGWVLATTRIGGLATRYIDPIERGSDASMAGLELIGDFMCGFLTQVLAVILIGLTLAVRSVLL